jgi:hypothetical protein
MQIGDFLRTFFLSTRYSPDIESYDEFNKKTVAAFFSYTHNVAIIFGRSLLLSNKIDFSDIVAKTSPCSAFSTAHSLFCLPRHH